MYELRHYTDTLGNDLFGSWLSSLRDKQIRVRVATRLLRLQNGNFGDCKSVGSGVWELRIHAGQGLRIYYALERGRVILLCHGGDKSTQSADIHIAIERWSEWNKRGSP